MHHRCKHCDRPRSRCVCLRDWARSMAKPQLLHIGGTWSPSHHSAMEAK